MVPIIYICHVSYFLWPVEAIHLLVMDWKEPGCTNWMFSLCHHELLPAAKRHSCYVNWWMWEWTVACLCVSSDWLVTCPRCTPSLSLLAQWQLNWVSGKKSMYVICYLYFKPAVYWVFSVNSYYSGFILLLPQINCHSTGSLIFTL